MNRPFAILLLSTLASPWVFAIDLPSAQERALIRNKILNFDINFTANRIAESQYAKGARAFGMNVDDFKKCTRKMFADVIPRNKAAKQVFFLERDDYVFVYIREKGDSARFWEKEERRMTRHDRAKMVRLRGRRFVKGHTMGLKLINEDGKWRFAGQVSANGKLERDLFETSADGRAQLGRYCK